MYISLNPNRNKRSNPSSYLSKWSSSDTVYASTISLCGQHGDGAGGQARLRQHRRSRLLSGDDQRR
jgi:hypothetical protein